MNPKILVLYAFDGQQMDEYLSEEMAQIIEYPLSIYHKRIENIGFDFENLCISILKSSAVIVILSTEFLNTISHLTKNVFYLTRLWSPSKTILMFFNCCESDLNTIHRSVLCGYRLCNRIVATQTHLKQFVINAIKLLQNILDLNEFNMIFVKRRNRFSYTPHFELSVDTVSQVNQKIYILLETAISETERIHLSIGVRNDILVVYWKNPYTLYFTLPEFMITYNKSLEISLICGNRHLGTQNLKCLTSISNEVIIEPKREKNERQRFSLNTVLIDEVIPQIPRKFRKDVFENETNKVYLNDDGDFYIIPERLNEKSEKILKTGSLDRRELERKFSIYDIPRSHSMTTLDSSQRQIFV